jgi:hypothetical protein
MMCWWRGQREFALCASGAANASDACDGRLGGDAGNVDIRERINLVFLLNYRIFNLSITPSIL